MGDLARTALRILGGQKGEGRTDSPPEVAILEDEGRVNDCGVVTCLDKENYHCWVICVCDST